MNVKYYKRTNDVLEVIYYKIIDNILYVYTCETLLGPLAWHRSAYTTDDLLCRTFIEIPESEMMLEML